MQSKINTDNEVIEIPQFISEAVENNYSNNIYINNITSNNITYEFAIEIPGQVNIFYFNNEHERTPGAVAVMQINRASPGKVAHSLPRISHEMKMPNHPCPNYGCIDCWLTEWNRNLYYWCHLKLRRNT